MDGHGLDHVMHNAELMCSCYVIIETSVIYTASQTDTHNGKWFT